MGPTLGVDVDSHDHIWVVHRNTLANFQRVTETDLLAENGVPDCCEPAPSVLVFDQAGNLLDSWGGPGTETGDYVWPESNHGITVDHMDNVWLGGNGGGDAHVLKFTRGGEFLMQVGRHNARVTGEDDDGNRIFQRDSDATDSYGRVANIGIDLGVFRRIGGQNGGLVGHRQTHSVRVCSPPSRRVAPLRPRSAGLTAWTPAPRTPVLALV